MKKTLSILSFLTAVCVPMLAHATYPERPINLIVPFPPGAGTDLTARSIASCMEKFLDGPGVVVVNRPGAAGDIGLSTLARSKPDGYTIGIVNTPGVLSIPIERKTHYTIDSFDFIANLVDDPATINVLGESEIKDINDLVAAAKKNPDAFTVGTQGPGSAGHLSLLALEHAADVSFSKIPFQGAAPASVALMGKVVDGTTANLGEALGFQAGRSWRILGVMSDKRFDEAPDVPTFREYGFDALGGSMRGLAGPKGMPEDVLEQLTSAVEQCSRDAEYLERARNTFQPLRYLPRNAYMESLKSVDKQLRALWAVKPWNSQN